MRPLAERLITFAKRGDLHARRRVLTVVHNGTWCTGCSPNRSRYANRNGGYAHHQLGPLLGDNAPMARIETVEPLSEQAVAEAEAAAKRAAKERDAREGSSCCCPRRRVRRRRKPEETAVAATEATEDAPGRLTRHRVRGCTGRSR